MIESGDRRAKLDPREQLDSSRTQGESDIQDQHEAKDLPGYNPGAPEVAKSPISLEELKELKASCLFTDEDMVYLRLSYETLKDQAEDLVTMWRAIIAQHTHLASYSFDRNTGKPDKEYGANTAAHIRGRDLIGFAAATVTPKRPYFEKGGHPPRRCSGCRTPGGSP
jgi:hypothetical protein